MSGAELHIHTHNGYHEHDDGPCETIKGRVMTSHNFATKRVLEPFVHQVCLLLLSNSRVFDPRRALSVSKE